MAEPFVYEGEVILGCQEGGFAAPEIQLAEVEGDNPQGTTAKVRFAFGGDQPKTLDEVLRDEFGPTERLNSFGDERVGRLRITVESL